MLDFDMRYSPKYGLIQNGSCIKRIPHSYNSILGTTRALQILFAKRFHHEVHEVPRREKKEKEKGNFRFLICLKERGLATIPKEQGPRKVTRADKQTRSSRKDKKVKEAVANFQAWFCEARKQGDVSPGALI
jgi:hypothetical protein